jgi:hypothetical protein
MAMNLEPADGPVGHRTARRLLIMLTCGDATFGTLHVVNEHTALLGDPRFDIELDRGYPEIYQYLKYLWAGMILTLHSFRQAAWPYLTWASVFAYFLVDDAVRIRERFADRVTANFDLIPILNLRLQDYGEMIIAAAAALLLLFPLGWAYHKGPTTFKNFSQTLFVLVLMLVFLGVLVDVGHVAIEPHVGETTFFVVGMIEDLGEMLVASMMLWYVYAQSRTQFASPPGPQLWLKRLFSGTQ